MMVDDAAGITDRPASAAVAPTRSVAARRRRLRLPLATGSLILLDSSRFGVDQMDRLLFGDNQFFGVNHMSEEKARAQAMQFQDIDAVQAVLDAAYDEGVTTFMCTTHDRIALVGRSRAGQPGALSGDDLLPVHAVRAQVRQRHDRGRADGRAEALPAGRGLPRRGAPGRPDPWPRRTSRASPRC